jgi:hypothetical protein
MTQYRAMPTTQYGCKPFALRIDDGMAYGIDASLHHMEVAASNSTANLVAGNSQFQQLTAGDDPVLPLSKSRNRYLQRSPGAPTPLGAHIAHNGVRIGGRGTLVRHGADPDGTQRTRGAPI